ncbi:hypothetical protein BT69DRAFT_1247020 [Atractiella rhizophila]|nr:hypothetical protein BT69DRAFT_1247020 [Atractiella rhizophila]
MSHARPYDYSDDDDGYEETLVNSLQQQAALGNGYYDNDFSAQQQAIAAAVREEQEAALAAVPNPVKNFVVHLHESILDRNVANISAAYEGFSRLTDKFYQKSEWPQAEVIAPLVNNDDVFVMFYRELYFRHVYSRLQPDLDDRFHSYENYCAIFNWILNSDSPVPMDLPPSWLYDIIDEFVYQFQSFVTWRSRVSKKTEEDIVILGDNPQVWSCYSVLNVLYSLIQKSKIQLQLPALRAGNTEEADEIGGEYGSKPLYRWLGYFSIIGLLRVHVLLGDYTLGLKMMEEIELNKKAMYTKVLPCHVTVYYYIGFAYLALRRYPDAIRTFTSILGLVGRLKQLHTRGYHYDSINKMADRMYALLAICHALCPTKTDDLVLNNMKEKYGEQYQRMVRGGEESLAPFEELFLYASPKFISPTPPPYDEPAQLPTYATLPDPAQFHLGIFLTQVKQHLKVPTLRSLLKLYTTLGTDKLSAFLETEEDETVQELMVMKGLLRSYRWSEGKGLLDGELAPAGFDVDFAISGDLVKIVESKSKPRFADYFIRNSIKAQDMVEQIKKKPLPSPAAATGAEGATQDGKNATPPQAATGGGKKVAWGTNSTVSARA